MVQLTIHKTQSDEQRIERRHLHLLLRQAQSHRIQPIAEIIHRPLQLSVDLLFAPERRQIKRVDWTSSLFF